MPPQLPQESPLLGDRGGTRPSRANAAHWSAHAVLMTVLSNLGVTFVEGSMTLTPSSDMDFPAAHSMDATWFAVDRDGHVGLFTCGEEGAVPTTEVNDFQREIGAVLEALDRLPVTSEAEFRLSAVLHPGLRAGALPRRESPGEGWPTEGLAELEPERTRA